MYPPISVIISAVFASLPMVNFTGAFNIFGNITGRYNNNKPNGFSVDASLNKR